MLFASSALAAEPEPAAPLDEDACTLNGEGFVERCDKVFWRSRLISLAAPSYVLATDGLRVRHGLSWTLAVDIPKGEWNQYFALGIDRSTLPRDVPSALGLAASFVWFPLTTFEGRIVIRARVMSLIWPSSPVRSWVHLSVGAGAGGGTLGFAPRIELRIRIGHVAWGGAVIVTGFQPYIRENLYVGDVALGVEAPWVWWW